MVSGEKRSSLICRINNSVEKSFFFFDIGLQLIFGGTGDANLEENSRPRFPLFPTAIYVYRCSLWIDVINDGRDELKIVGSHPVVSVGSSATVANDNEIFILGGFFGQVIIFYLCPRRVGNEIKGQDLWLST
jgi:hypothetical protein